MEAARTVRQALSEAVQGIDRAAGRLLPVLERLTRRHDTAAERLYHLVRDAQADPARTPEALRAAAETASTAEQIQAVSGMIRDKLRKRQAETEAAVHTALQQGMDAASLARYVRRCWGDGASENAAQQAAHDREMLDRVKSCLLYTSRCV